MGATCSECCRSEQQGEIQLEIYRGAEDNKLWKTISYKQVKLIKNLMATLIVTQEVWAPPYSAAGLM